MSENYMKDGRRYRQAPWPMPISVKTHHQGYALQVGDVEFMYYTVPDLIKGLAVHAGLEQENFYSSEELNQLLDAIVNGSALKKALNEVVELKKVISRLKIELRKMKKNNNEK